MKVLYFDVEWANSQNKSICQMGLVSEEFETGEPLLPELNIYVDPEDKFDRWCMEIHHINSKKVEGCKNFAHIWEEISEYFTNSVIIGHNVKCSDLNALVKCLHRYNLDIPELWCIDTYFLARNLIKPFLVPDYKLSTLCDFFHIDMDNEHDAFDDACACADLLRAFVEYYEINIEDYIEHYAELETEKFIPYVSSVEFRREINQLYGVVSSIEMDGKVVEKEKVFLMKWREEHSKYKGINTVSFVINVIDEILKDGIITIDELNFLKNKIIEYLQFEKSSKETMATQYLQGLVEGIKSDKIIQDIEVYKLQKWLYENDYLLGHYPYDKIIKLVNQILEDNVITTEERTVLSDVFEEMFKPLENIGENTILFMNKAFCLSGTFEHGKKSDIEKHICSKGGAIDKNVKKTTDYIVVGSVGSDEYTNGTYGTKVKKAMEFGVAVVKEDQIFN